MDNATHAFAGLLLADATAEWVERRVGAPIDGRLRRLVVGLGIVAAELPDGDLLYSGPVVGMGKLGYLLHHRGHTHTIVFALAAALALWWIARALQRLGGRTEIEAARVPLLVLALVGTLSHLLLDFTNSYGVHPFWPLDNHWYYGDAVFIAEPWLWIAAIPPLVWGPRRALGRSTLIALYGLMLLASWTLGQLSTTLAIVVTVTAALWMLAQRWVQPTRRTSAGIAAWVVVEAVFAMSSARTRTITNVPLGPDERVVDAALTPAPANPLCFDAVVVSLSRDLYIVRTAVVTPWSASGSEGRSTARCFVRASTGRFGEQGRRMGSTSDQRVRWIEQWSAPRTELRELAATRCEFAAALRFMRVPVWRIDSTKTVSLYDARFGADADGFAGLRIGDGGCTLAPRSWIPPWTPPTAGLTAGFTAG